MKIFPFSPFFHLLPFKFVYPDKSYFFPNQSITRIFVQNKKYTPLLFAPINDGRSYYYYLFVFYLDKPHPLDVGVLLVADTAHAPELSLMDPDLFDLLDPI